MAVNTAALIGTYRRILVRTSVLGGRNVKREMVPYLQLWNRWHLRPGSDIFHPDWDSPETEQVRIGSDPLVQFWTAFQIRLLVYHVACVFFVFVTYKFE